MRTPLQEVLGHALESAAVSYQSDPEGPDKLTHTVDALIQALRTSGLMGRALTTEQADEIANIVEHRRSTWQGESLHTSIMVALFNFGEQYTEVTCIGGEWHGTKAQLRGQPGTLPHCPNLHPLTESANRMAVGLVHTRIE